MTIRRVAVGKRGKVAPSLGSPQPKPNTVRPCSHRGFCCPRVRAALRGGAVCSVYPRGTLCPKDRTPRSSRPERRDPAFAIPGPVCGSLPRRHLFKADVSGAGRGGRLRVATAFPTSASAAGSPGREPKAICFGGKMCVRPSWAFPSFICPLLLIINRTVMRIAFNRICCHHRTLLPAKGFPQKDSRSRGCVYCHRLPHRPPRVPCDVLPATPLFWPEPHCPPPPRICCLPWTESYPLPETRGVSCPFQPSQARRCGLSVTRAPGPVSRDSVGWTPPCAGPGRAQQLTFQI